MTRLLALGLLAAALPLSACQQASRLASQATGALSGVEVGVDRPGSDYRNFDTNNAGPAACQQACQADADCRAWTHTAPGTQAPGGMCWLKNRVPDAVALQGATSGVVRRTAGGPVGGTASGGTAGGTGAGSGPALPGVAMNPAGTWETSYGAMRLRVSNDGAQVRGTYDLDDGRIDGQIVGGVLTGFWTATTASRECGTARDGRTHWGRVRFTFVSPDRFEGTWSYCDDALADDRSGWTGTRTG